MKASEFAAHLVDRGASLVLRDGRLIARGASTLPAWTQQALSAHRADLLAYVAHGEDRDLKPSAARRELRRLGFVEVAEVGVMCHPQGDEKGDAILLGLISPDEVEREQKQTRREAAALGDVQPAKPIKPDVTHVGPGHYLWSEERDQAYAPPFPKLSTILE